LTVALLPPEGQTQFGTSQKVLEQREVAENNTYGWQKSEVNIITTRLKYCLKQRPDQTKFNKDTWEMRQA
jgi:hypothetical protein